MDWSKPDQTYRRCFMFFENSFDVRFVLGGKSSLLRTLEEQHNSVKDHVFFRCKMPSFVGECVKDCVDGEQQKMIPTNHLTRDDSCSLACAS